MDTSHAILALLTRYALDIKKTDRNTAIVRPMDHLDHSIVIIPLPHLFVPFKVAFSLDHSITMIILVNVPTPYYVK